MCVKATPIMSNCADQSEREVASLVRRRGLDGSSKYRCRSNLPYYHLPATTGISRLSIVSAPRCCRPSRRSPGALAAQRLHGKALLVHQREGHCPSAELQRIQQVRARNRVLRSHWIMLPSVGRGSRGNFGEWGVDSLPTAGHTLYQSAICCIILPRCRIMHDEIHALPSCRGVWIASKT